MGSLKKIAENVPFIHSIYKILQDKYVKYKLKSNNTENTFTDIYRNNAWGGKDSVSGRGSDIYQTRVIITELPVLFSNLNISTMLDIPCGDFHWMKNVDLKNIHYSGADIVKELVQKNIEQYQKEHIGFKCLNLITDNLPKVDLIFCRDCLVHLSFDDIWLALGNVCNSHSEYFLTTTFINRAENHDIKTGQWRTINLEVAPFSLPRPLKIIIEGCTENNGIYEDKALGLWRIVDIRDSLLKRSLMQTETNSGPIQRAHHE